MAIKAINGAELVKELDAIQPIKRIDLEQFEGKHGNGYNITPNKAVELTTELKRCYEEIDKLCSDVTRANAEYPSDIVARVHGISDASFSDLQRLRIHDEVCLVFLWKFLRNNASE